jgi:hypothetical protein
MQLVLVAHRRGAAFEVADVAAGIGDDQRALELARLGRVDAEVGRQFHRAAHAGRDVDERAVGEHGRIQRRVEVVAIRRHDAAQVLLDQFRVLLHGLGERAEDQRRPSASFALNVVATDTLSNTASTATPASRARSCSGTPSFS